MVHVTKFNVKLDMNTKSAILKSLKRKAIRIIENYGVVSFSKEIVDNFMLIVLQFNIFFYTVNINARYCFHV